MKLRPFPPMPEELYNKIKARGFDVYGSGKPDLHHAILTKNDMKGMPDSEKIKIHDECNILVIPSKDNASHANVPSRDRAYHMLRRHYTKHQIHKWFNGINFKDGRPPFRLPED